MKNAKLMIRKQLLVVLKTEDIHSVKIREIIDPLEISRSTFYLYYDSIFSVLQEIEDEFFDGMAKLSGEMRSYLPNNKYLSEPHPCIVKTLSFMRDNKETAKVLWGPYGDQMFRNRCRNMVQEAFFPEYIYDDIKADETPYWISFMIGGHLDLINFWISNDCEYPIEDLSLLIYRMMFGHFNNMSLELVSRPAT